MVHQRSFPTYVLLLTEHTPSPLAEKGEIRP